MRRCTGQSDFVERVALRNSGFTFWVTLIICLFLLWNLFTYVMNAVWKMKYDPPFFFDQFCPCVSLIRSFYRACHSRVPILWCCAGFFFFLLLYKRSAVREQATVLWVCLAIPSTGQMGDRNDWIVSRFLVSTPDFFPPFFLLLTGIVTCRTPVLMDL